MVPKPDQEPLGSLTGIAKQDAVEEVERLAAQLQFPPLGNGEVAHPVGRAVTRCRGRSQPLRSSRHDCPLRPSLGTSHWRAGHVEFWRTFYPKIMLRLPKRLALVALLIAQAGNAASPVRILIAYHSQTRNTAKLAAAVRKGAASVAGAEVLLRAVEEATTDDIVKSDGIVLGTPVHWGNLSAEFKRFLDRVGVVGRSPLPALGRR